ncbi:MAG: DUF4363 family protein [Firmicutes bacterium]|nr:DUF4363 family protein [Bacillota bacterium]
MKTIWIAVFLLLALLVGAVALFICTTALHNELQESLHRMYLAVEEEDWPAAHRESEQLQKVWNRTDASWTPIMDHRQVDRLDESLSRVIRLTQLCNREQLLIELPLAIRMAKRIKDTEIPSIGNIF